MTNPVAKDYQKMVICITSVKKNILKRSQMNSMNRDKNYLEKHPLSIIFMNVTSFILIFKSYESFV